MITLAINTAEEKENVALIRNKHLLKEITWKGNHDESEKLLPAIKNLLKSNKLSFGDIGRIICVKGPGPFSALRIGITTANILSFCLKKTLFSIETKTLAEIYLPQGFGLTIARAGKSVLKKEKLINPLYLRPPNITKPKK